MVNIFPIFSMLNNGFIFPGLYIVIETLRSPPTAADTNHTIILIFAKFIKCVNIGPIVIAVVKETHEAISATVGSLCNIPIIKKIK